METKITFYKNQNHSTPTIAARMMNRIFSAALGSIMMFGLSINTKAQTTLVVPDSNEGSAFIDPSETQPENCNLLSTILC